METTENNEGRTYFPLYRSFVEQIRMFPTEQQLKWYNIIIDYALNYKEPVFNNNMEQIIWMGMKPNLDSSMRHYVDGKKGGCPRGTQKPTMKGNKNASKKDSPSKEMPNNEEIKLKKIPKNVFK